MNAPSFTGKPLMPQLAKLFLIGALLVCSASVCTKTSSDDEGDIAASFSLDEDQATTDLTFLTAAPHPFGSEYQTKVGDYLLKRAAEAGADEVVAQAFKSETPNPSTLEDTSGPRPLTLEKTGRNIIGKVASQNHDCWIILGSHYDTKEIPGISYLGANDSGSSSALLLQLISHFKIIKADPGCGILFVWFDGEEAVLSDWTTGQTVHPAKIQDNTYGSRHFVDQLSKCGEERCYEKKPVRAMILLDMVGMPNLKLSLDSNSTPALQRLMIDAATELGLEKHIAERTRMVEDDHIPFLNAGIPSLNIINFEDLSVWHRDGDELEAVSTKSIEIAGQIATLTVLKVNSLPKDL